MRSFGQPHKKKSRIRETPNLLTFADSITDICFLLAWTKGLISVFFLSFPFLPAAAAVVAAVVTAAAVTAAKWIFSQKQNNDKNA